MTDHQVLGLVVGIIIGTVLSKIILWIWLVIRSK